MTETTGDEVAVLLGDWTWEYEIEVELDPLPG